MKKRNSKSTIARSSTLLLAFVVLLTTSILASSCNGSDNVDCDPGLNCEQFEPTEGLLNLNLSANNENPTVPIAVYYGNADDSSLYFRDTIFSGELTSYAVPISQRYSIVAKYFLQGRRVYLVDGGKVRLKTETNCGYTCYKVKDLDLNLKVAR